MRQTTKDKARASRCRSGGLIETLEARCLLAVTPASPTISNLTSTETAISFAWASPDGSSVKLEEKGPTDLNYHLCDTLGTTSGNYGLSNLTPNRQYSLRLRSEIEGVVAYTDASIRTQESVATPFGDLALPAPVMTGDSYTYSGPQPSSAILYRRWNDHPDFMGGPLWTVLDPVNTYMGTMGQWWTSAEPSGSWGFPGGVGLNYSVKGFTMCAGSTSPWSNAGTFSPSGTPTAAPTNFTATTALDGGVDINWSAVQGGTIYRYFIMGGNGLGTTVDTSVAGTVLTYHVDSSLMTNHVWTFTVMAQGGPGAISPMATPASVDRTGAIPAAPTDFRAYLGDGKDLVRLVWDNVPNTESGFHVQIKESTAPDTDWADAWAGGGTVGADLSTKEFALPANYAGKTYSVRICAYNSGGNSDYAQTTASGVALRSVTFGGTGFQTIMRDSGSAVYTGAQWYDDDLNGVIGGTPAYTNLTVDPRIPYIPDRRFPLSYIRSTAGQASVMTAQPLLSLPISSGQLRIRASGSGLTFPEQVVMASSAFITAGEALPESIGNSTVALTWELSTDGGHSYFALGSTTNHLYVTGAAANEAFETVIDLGCREANGKNPDTQQADVVAGIWSQFSSGNAPANVHRVDDTSLTYYHNYDTDSTGIATLLSTGDGQCGAWAKLLWATLALQGVAGIHYVGLTPEASTTHGANGFLVNNWTFTGAGTSGSLDFPYVNIYTVSNINASGTGYQWSFSEVTDASGVSGQGNSDPASYFTSHDVLSITIGSTTKYYDPSYGRIYDNLDQIDATMAGYFVEEEDVNAVAVFFWQNTSPSGGHLHAEVDPAGVHY